MGKILESGEMYLENILILRNEIQHVRSIDVANYSGYSKPSISRALGLLRKDGMITVDECGYIFLTDAGEVRAKKIYERHRLLSQFFTNIGVDPDTAVQDACKIEHDISDITFEKLKKFVAAAFPNTTN